MFTRMIPVFKYEHCCDRCGTRIALLDDDIEVGEEYCEDCKRIKFGATDRKSEVANND